MDGPPLGNEDGLAGWLEGLWEEGVGGDGGVSFCDGGMVEGVLKGVCCGKDGGKEVGWKKDSCFSVKNEKLKYVIKGDR